MQLNKLFSIIMTIACVGFISPRSAFPIGRTGDLSIGDLTQGYTASVPHDFDEISQLDKGSVALNSNYLLDPQFGLTEFIQANPFAASYPDLANANSATVLAYFQTAPQMTYTVVTTSNCSLSLIGEGATTWVGVSTWGNGTGYVLVAAKTDEAKQGIMSVLMNTQIAVPCWQ